MRWWLFGLAAFVLAPLVALRLEWSIGNTVVWATGVVILLYTIETHEMRRAMARANIMQVQPVLITKLGDPPPGGGTGQRLWLWNVGKGTALRVKLEDINIEVEGLQGKPAERLAVRFFTADVLEPGAGTEVTAKFGVASGATFTGKFDFIANLTPGYANQDHEIVIRYEDVDGRRYVSEMSMGKAGTRLVRMRAGE